MRKHIVTKQPDMYPDLWGLIGFTGLTIAVVLAGLTIGLLVLSFTH